MSGLDPRLDGFAQRILDPQDWRDQAAAQIKIRVITGLDGVITSFRDSCSVPYEDELRQMGPDAIIQNKIGCGTNQYEVMTLNEVIDSLLNPEVGKVFASKVQHDGIKTLYRLPLADTRIRLWKPPFRLLLDYYIATDGWAGCIDLIGSTK